MSPQDTGRERRAMLQQLARRVLHEAHPHGFRADELVKALTEETDGRTTTGKENPR